MRHTFVACVGSLFACTGCFHDEKLEPCNSSVEFGQEYEVTVVSLWADARAQLESTTLDPYDWSAPPCVYDDIKPGDRFTIRIEGESRTSRVCVDPLCPDAFPTESSPYPEGYLYVGASYLCMNEHRKVQLSPSCEAARFVGLADNPFANATRPADGGTGTTPATILTRGLAVPAGARPNLRCDSPEQSFPEAAQDSAMPGHWRCSDHFVVDVRKK